MSGGWFRRSVRVKNMRMRGGGTVQYSTVQYLPVLYSTVHIPTVLCYFYLAIVLRAGLTSIQDATSQTNGGVIDLWSWNCYDCMWAMFVRHGWCVRPVRALVFAEPSGGPSACFRFSICLVPRIANNLYSTSPHGWFPACPKKEMRISFYRWRVVGLL